MSDAIAYVLLFCIGFWIVWRLSALQKRTDDLMMLIDNLTTCGELQDEAISRIEKLK